VPHDLERASLRVTGFPDPELYVRVGRGEHVIGRTEFDPVSEPVTCRLTAMRPVAGSSIATS